MATAVTSAPSRHTSTTVKPGVHPPSVKEGWLHKMGGNVKTWKLRYFRLYKDEVLYFDSDVASTPKGSIPIKGSRLSVYSADLTPEHPYCLSITPQASPRAFLIAAASHAERMEWIAALRPLCRIALKAQSGSLKEGYLTKQGGRVKTWKKRWVILTDKAMVYYKDVKDVCEAGEGGIDSLDLSGGFDVDVERGGKDGEWVFTVKPEVGSGRVYKFATQAEAERDSWVRILKQVKQRIDAQTMNITF